MTSLHLAALFHDTYERLAPLFGYETRPETHEFRPASPSGWLMVAVCKEILQQLSADRCQSSHTCPTNKAGCLTGCLDCPYEMLKPVDLRRLNVPPEHPDLDDYVYDIYEREALGNARS